MKKRLLLLTFFGLTLGSFAQIDTVFWFAAPDFSSGLGQSPVKLYLSSYNQPANVTISQPANGGFTPINLSLPASSTDSVDLTPFLATLENSPANTPNNWGLKISASSNISALYAVKANGNKEFITLKGSNGIGTDFYTPFSDNFPNGNTTPRSFSSIEIVATQNNTTVLITPRTNIIGNTQNVTYSITLQRGQTYCARDTNATAATCLAGSIISSDKPIAVTVFQGGISSLGCLSTIADQITTSDFIGGDYVINKGNSSNEFVYILATQNNTALTINNGVGTTNHVINFCETYRYAITQPLTYIKSTKPVYVLHVNGSGCEMSGAQVPNFFCAGGYAAAFTRTTADSLSLNIFTRNGYQTGFSLNGNSALISPASFTPVPGTSGNIVSAKLFFNTTDVPVGSYNIVTSTADIFGLGVHNGSQANGSSYAYFSQYLSNPFINAGQNDTICSNTTLNLNGVIGGGSVTGTWTTNGFGSFLNGPNALTNTYVPSQLDTAIKPIRLVLTTTGPCPQLRDTIRLIVTPFPLVSASVDQILCANQSVAQLNGSVSGGSSTGIWTSSGTGTFLPNANTLNATYIPSTADTAAGMVTLVLTSTNNGSCGVERDTMHITYTDAPTADAGPASVSSCANNPSVSLNGVVGGSATSGKWTSAGTGVFSPSNIVLNPSYNPSPADVLAGQVWLKFETTNNGSCLAAMDSILLTFSPAPTVFAGADTFVCRNNAAVTLNGLVSGPTTSGLWSGGSGVFLPNNGTLNAVYVPSTGEISSGSVTLTLTSSNNGGCNAVSDQVKLNFVPEPFTNFSYNNVCLNRNTQFNDFSIPSIGVMSTWNWNFGDGNTSTSQNPVHMYANPGTYTVTLISKNTFGCADTAIKSVKVYPLPDNGFTVTRNCVGTSISLSFTDTTKILPTDTVTTWFWDFGGIGTSTLQNPTQGFPGAGSYTVTLITTSNNNCKDTVIKPIVINPLPDAGFYFNVNAGLNVITTVNFTDTSKYATSIWWNFGDPGSGPNNTSTISGPVHQYLVNGIYMITLVAYDQFGCTDTAKAYINVKNETENFLEIIPNAISPNGDGKNDTWNLLDIPRLYPNLHVEIYNRWGQKMFESDGYSKAWDGTFNGEKLPVGTYFFVLDLKDPNANRVYKGSILLMR